MKIEKNVITKTLSNKNSFFINLTFSAIGIINLVLYIIFDCMNMVKGGVAFYMGFVMYFVTVWLMFAVQFIFKMKFKLLIVIFYQLFLLVAIIGGSLWRGYDLPVYDKIVHFGSGVLFALVFYELYKNNKKNNLSKFWLFVCVFAFAMMVSGVWEIYEYTFDGLAGQNMQRARGFVGREALADTLFDMISDFFGGLVGATIALILDKKSSKEISSIQRQDTSDQSVEQKS